MSAKIPKSEQSEAQLASGRRALRVLRMVHELHKLGYQQLRICPGMNASGTAWRCGITPAINICRNHGAYWVKENLPDLTANYTSADENKYFGWTDAASSTVQELAKKFLERFPRLVQAAHARDWEYAGWFVEMLGMAEQDDFPMACADFQDNPRPGYLSTTKNWYGSVLPMPPAGLADTLCDLGHVTTVQATKNEQVKKPRPGRPVTRNDWKLKPMPKKHVRIPLERSFTSEEMDKIKLGFKPDSMDDHWFLYFEKGRLYCHRSWTGFCIFIAHFKRKQGRNVLHQIEVNRNPKQYSLTDEDHDIKEMNSVLDYFLLGRPTM